MSSGKNVRSIIARLDFLGLKILEHPRGRGISPLIWREWKAMAWVLEELLKAGAIPPGGIVDEAEAALDHFYDRLEGLETMMARPPA